MCEYTEATYTYTECEQKPVKPRPSSGPRAVCLGTSQPSPLYGFHCLEEGHHDLLGTERHKESLISYMKNLR
jgi:hypothetical protein